MKKIIWLLALLFLITTPLLTIAQVNNNYLPHKINSSLDSGLVAYYPFNGNANDESGKGNNGAIIGATLTTDRFGNTNNAYLFDGVSSQFDSKLVQNVSKNFTLSLWFLPYQTHQIDVESNSGTLGISGQKYLLFPSQGSGDWGSDFTGVGISAGTNGVSVYEHTNSYLPALLVYQKTLSGWIHLVLKYENNRPSLYLNGELVRSGLQSSIQYARISSFFGGGYYGFFNGKLDDIRIYERVLSNQDILSLYSEKGWENPFVKITSPIGGENLLVGQQKSITWASNITTDVRLEYSTDNGTIWQNIVSSTLAKSGSYTWTVPNTPSATCKVRITSLTNSAVKSVSDSVFSIRNPLLTDSLVSYYPFNGNANDESGKGNNGTVSGATLTTDRFGSANKAYSFNGSSNYISTTKNYLNPVLISYSVWFKTTTTSGGKILGLGNSQTGLSNNYDRHIYMANNGKLFWGVYSGGGRVINTSQSYNDGKWHHVVASLSSNGMYLYIDGIFIAKDITITSADSFTGFFRIGFDRTAGWPSAPGSDYFNGSIDDIRIYNRTLLDSEIKSLYDMITITAPVVGDNWQVSSTKNITWTSNNSGYYKLEYSTNNGTKWQTIVASTPAWSGSYAWTIPNTLALNSCQVKISSVENPAIFVVSNAFSIVSNLPAATPILSSPANNTTGEATTTTLMWQPVSDAVNYQLQVSSSPAFNGTFYDNNTLTSVTVQLTTLQLGVKYYWRVRAKNYTGWGNFTEAWCFTVTRTLPAVPVLISPLNYSVYQPQNLKLDWTTVTGAENYKIQISKDSLFVKSTVNDSTVFTKYYPPSSLEGNTKYYWRVKSQNSAGSSAYSSVWSFTTRTGTSGLVINLPITISDNAGSSKELRFGLGQNATDGVDIDLDEDELPPLPPAEVFDARFNLAGGKALLKDYRQGNDNTVGAAIHEIQYQTGSGNKITLSWALPENVTFRIQDAATNGTLVDVTATGTGNYTIQDPAAVNRLKTTVNYKLGIPLSPVLYQPANNSINQDVDQTFKWSARTKATSYKLEIATDSLFANMIKDTTLADTSKLVNGLANNVKYFWRVSAKNSLGSSLYSPIWNFKTKAGANNITTITGRVTDSRNGNPISGAVVTLLNQSATTDQTGYYEITNIPAGALVSDFSANPVAGTAPLQVQFTDYSTENTYTISVTKSEFVTYQNNHLVLIPNITNSFDISLTPQLSLGKMRIVLNWGATPSDIDSHLKTPEINGTAYHIYYSSRGDSVNIPNAILDVDKRIGYGPETITIHQFYPGKYSYYVHRFTYDGLLTASNAVVQIYTTDGLVKTYNVPTSGSGIYWHVCDIDGDTKTITDVNQLRDTAPGTLLASERNLPAKDNNLKPDVSGEVKNPIIAASPQTITSWEWNFGDSTKSTLQSPTHTYSVPGIYTVSLKVSNGTEQSTETKTNYITVNSVSGTIQLNSPNGGQNWQAGSAQNITWASSNVNKVKIEYTTNNGSIWTKIADSLTATASPYNWLIPNTPSAQCKVKVSDISNASVFDASDSVFTISAAVVPGITLISPNGGQNWQARTIQNITWQSANISKIKIEYTTNNGTAWTMIADSVNSSPASYSWMIPNTPSALCKVKVSDITNSSVTDISDSAFTISAAPMLSIGVVAPNGGENWLAGTNQNITWISSDISKIKIEYTTNNGTAWNKIADSVNSTPASYNWLIPNTPSSLCKVKISDIGSSGISDISDNVFTISAAANNLTVKLDTVSAATMDSVVVPMRVKNFNGVAALTIVIQFDTTKLSFGRALNWNSLLTGAIAGVNKDRVTVAWDNLTPISIADEKLVDLKFFFKGDTQTSLNFVSSASEITDEVGNVKVATFTNGLIIPGVNITGTVVYDNISQTPISGAQVYLKSDTVTVKTTTTDANGAYSFTSVANGNYTITGSCTKAWGGVNSTDALQVRRHIASVSVLTGLKLTAADVNASGSVNSTDALFIRRRIASTITSFAAGDWAFESIPVTISSSNITQSIKGICIGDVNGSYVPTVSKAGSSIALSRSTEIKLSGNQITEIPILINREIKAGAITLILNYTSANTIVTSVKSKIEGLTYSINKGKIVIVWDDINPVLLKEGDAIASLIVKLVDESNKAIDVQISIDSESEIADREGKIIENLKLNVPELSIAKIEGYQLMQNYPNPFNPSTTIKYALPLESRVNIVISNSLGQIVRTLVNGVKPSGVHEVKFDAGNLPSGIYFYSMEAKAVDGSKTFKSVNKLILMK